MIRERTRTRILVGLAFAVGPLLWPLLAGAAQAHGPVRDELDDHLARLVTEIRASVPDLGNYEPFMVLPVLHDERGYRVRASDLLERRLATALAAQGVRVIDQATRQRILEDLQTCYTDEAPFCRARDVVGRFATAGGILEPSVLSMRGGVEVRVKLVVAAGASELTAGEILGTWSVVVPPPALDSQRDLVPALGAISYGLPPAAGDSVPLDDVGELRVDVRTQDGSRAWVQIDGRVVVPAPVITTTTAGRHLLTVTAVGHRPFSDYVHVPPGGIVSREIVLALGVGTIVVTANAEDALVYLDDQFVGTTPWVGREIEAGRHQVRIERIGFDRYTKSFALEHQEEYHIKAILSEHPGDIVVTCVHDGIQVYLDHARGGPVGGCSTGEALTIQQVSAGKHLVWGRRGSHSSDTLTVIVRGGEAVPLRLALRLGSAPRSEVGTNDEGWQGRSSRRRPDGLYFSVGWVAGQAEWQMDMLSGPESFSLEGDGPRVATGVYASGWEITLGADLVFLKEVEGIFEGSNEYFEFFVDLTRYFRRDKKLQPFGGLRGHWNTLTFRDPEDLYDDLSSDAVGFGGHVGLNIRLGRKSSLEIGASYSYTGRRDLIEEGDAGVVPIAVIEARDWEFASGYIVLKVGTG
ncbi:MAG: PEGA domain-containing protein [Gemmatimonadota bacterium]|nr:MAG: PEGA domain-containing protein [Gemmatimonadota bacterium]